MSTSVPSSNADRLGAVKPKLLFFFEPASGRCRRAEGHVAQVLQRRRNHDTFDLVRIPVDRRPDLAERFRVESVPTILVVDNRRVRARLEGPKGVPRHRVAPGAVAQLTDAAAAARESARRLRTESQALRFAARRAVHGHRKQVASCAVTFEASRAHTVQLCSPWSPLPWRAPGTELLLELDGVLEAV